MAMGGQVESRKGMTGWVLEKMKKATISSSGWEKDTKKISKEYNEFKRLKKGGENHSFDCNE